MRQTEKHLIQIFFSRSCVTVVRAYYINYLISVFFKVFSSKFFGFLWIISALSSGDTYFKSGFISLHWFLLFYKSIRQLPHLRPKQGMRATAFILHVILQHLLFPLLTFHQILLEKSNALVSSYIWLWCRVLQFVSLHFFIIFIVFTYTTTLSVCGYGNPPLWILLKNFCIECLWLGGISFEIEFFYRRASIDIKPHLFIFSAFFVN